MSFRSTLGTLVGEPSLEPQHPDAGELVAYCANELDEEASQRLRQHVEICEECTLTLRDLSGEHTADDPEMSAAWESLRARLEPHE